MAATPASAADLVDRLAAAYRSMDLDLYRTLFASQPRDGIEFKFVLYEPSSSGETEWGYDEEMRVHRRMWRPREILPGESPVPERLWLSGIDVALEPLTAWTERFDLYRSDQNPTAPLDRKRWCATDAVYATSVTWHTLQAGDLHIAGQARFVVVENLLCAAGDAGRFLVFQWEDLGPGGLARSTR